MPKYYFYNAALVRGDEGIRFENIVASALLKACHHQVDVEGLTAGLHYLRDKSGHEIDFLTQVDDQLCMIEVKNKQANISKHFSVFAKQLPNARQVQLVNHLTEERSNSAGVAVKKAENWLQDMPLG